MCDRQPPSGGCVLKPVLASALTTGAGAAAFGRLCVETGVYQRFAQNAESSHLRVAVC